MTEKTAFISFVNVTDRYVMLESGESVPITNLFDVDGDETEEDADVVAVVAGPDPEGMWLTVDLSEFESEVTIH